MDQGSLVTQQIDAAAKFVREFAKYTPVRTAFWLKKTEDKEWFLYLVGDAINDSNFDLAYAEVIRIAAKMPDPWLDPFQIKVMGTQDRVAKAVLEIQEEYPTTLPRRSRLGRLGDVTVEEIYIYPPAITVPV